MSKLAILRHQFDPYRGGSGGGGGGGGEFDLLSRLSTYGFLLPPNTFYGSKCNTYEDNRGVHMNFKLFGWYL